MTVTERIRAHLLAGIDYSPVGDKTESLGSLRLSEWSPQFERHMRDRMLMGRFRYGRLDRTKDTDYDRVESILSRLRTYRETGNLETLVDIANLCLLEFEHGTHPTRHFEPVDDGEHMGRTKC